MVEALIWQSGVQRGQREIAYLSVCLCVYGSCACVPVLSDDPCRYPAKPPQHGGWWFFFHAAKCGYINRAQHDPSQQWFIARVHFRRHLDNSTCVGQLFKISCFLSLNRYNRNTKALDCCTVIPSHEQKLISEILKINVWGTESEVTDLEAACLQAWQVRSPHWPKDYKAVGFCWPWF